MRPLAPGIGAAHAKRRTPAPVLGIGIRAEQHQRGREHERVQKEERAQRVHESETERRTCVSQTTYRAPQRAQRVPRARHAASPSTWRRSMRSRTGSSSSCVSRAAYQAATAAGDRYLTRPPAFCARRDAIAASTRPVATSIAIHAHADHTGSLTSLSTTKSSGEWCTDSEAHTAFGSTWSVLSKYDASRTG